MIKLTTNPISVDEVLTAVRSPEAGAVVLFLGTVRGWTAGRQTLSLEYEAHTTMAPKKLEGLREQAVSQWNLSACSIVHRVGVLAVGEIAVAIATSAPHRDAAFAACSWIIDQLKRDVPIWKKEIFADGTTEWIHPGLPERAVDDKTLEK